LPSEPGTVVWESGDVRVSAVGTVHIAGSLAYRVEVAMPVTARQHRPEPRPRRSRSRRWPSVPTCWCIRLFIPHLLRAQAAHFRHRYTCARVVRRTLARWPAVPV
jgi:hypothetical protein